MFGKRLNSFGEPKGHLLFLNSQGNFIVQTQGLEPNLDDEFVKRHGVEIRESSSAVVPNAGETVQFSVKFCARTKCYKRNPKSFQASGGKERKNGIMLGDKEEALAWLREKLHNGGLEVKDFRIDMTECWSDGKNGKVIAHSASGSAKVGDFSKVKSLMEFGLGNCLYLGLGLVLVQ
jgi:hypothetical protein